MKPRRALTSEERRQLRRAKTNATEKFTIGGQLKKRTPAPITLRRFDAEKQT